MQKCIELAPKSAEYRFNLGMLLLTQQRFREAADAFRECVKLRPTQGMAQFGLGECLLALEDRAGAKIAFEAADRLLPDDERIKQRLKQLAGEQEDTQAMP
jgi:tetratricopeptide (TPR) repeat protein